MDTLAGHEHSLLDMMLDAWDRNNAILLNLLRVLPEGSLETRASQGSPSVSELFSHMHHERMISVSEEAPEFAGRVPEHEWRAEGDRRRIAENLQESADVVRAAVRGRVQAGRDLDLHYDHPFFLLQLLIFHESYHHGQIKLALKLAGQPIPDDVAGPLTWNVWRKRRSASP